MIYKLWVYLMFVDYGSDEKSSLNSRNNVKDQIGIGNCTSFSKTIAAF